MKNIELQELLKQYPDDIPVMLQTDDQYFECVDTRFIKDAIRIGEDIDEDEGAIDFIALDYM